jgi:DNA (cytosine-5)-methyltransferase 1
MEAAVRPTSISLFTGAGGLDLGLETAGFRTVAAVDHDPDCIATLRANQALDHPCLPGRRFFEGTNILHARIEDVPSLALPCLGVSSQWTPDLLVGGPPCQPFSSAGKMQSVDDPRGRLYEHFVRLAAALRPKLILFENVRGLVTARGPSGQPGEALFRLKQAFEEIGYATSFALLNAADFGAAQRRVRCFMLATRCTAVPLFPKPTHAEKPTRDLFEERRPWVTLGQFLATLPPPDEADIVRPSPRLLPLLAGIQRVLV